MAGAVDARPLTMARTRMETSSAKAARGAGVRFITLHIVFRIARRITADSRFFYQDLMAGLSQAIDKLLLHASLFNGRINFGDNF